MLHSSSVLSRLPLVNKGTDALHEKHFLAEMGRLWKVHRMISKDAKQSESFYQLGRCLNSHDYVSSLNPTRRHEMSALGQHVLTLKDAFDDYFFFENTSEHDMAVRFLVVVSALYEGIDAKEAASQGRTYEWQSDTVRATAHGIYDSMMDCRDDFESHNIPLIEHTMNDIRQLCGEPL